MIIFTLSFTIIILFLLSFRNKGLPIISFLLVVNTIMITGFNKDLFATRLEIADIFFFSTLLAFSIYGLINKRKYILTLNYGDLLISLYLLIIVLIPYFIWFLTSGYTANVVYIHKYFIPLRMLLLYRMWYLLFSEYTLRKENTGIIINKIFNYLIIVGIFSAIIGILRFLPFDGVNSVFTLLWPAEQFGIEEVIMGENMFRLWGTNGATNSAGNLFAVLLILSMWFLKNEWKKYYIFSVIIFSAALLLTGSFSSIIAVLILIVFSKKIRNIKSISIFIILSVVAFIGLMSIDILFELIKRRFLDQLYQIGNFELPSNLVARLSYWDSFWRLSINNDKLWFGWGPGGARNYTGPVYIHGNPESFYFRIFNDSGIFAVIYLIIFLSIIYNSAKFLIQKGSIPEIITPILSILIIAGIANQTFYYGALTEIFTFVLALIYFYKTSRNSINKKIMKL
jgi:hypothetical protein